MFHRLMAANNIEAIPEVDRQHEVLKLHVMYDRLTTGKLNDDSYVAMVEMLLVAFHLAKQLHELGSETVRFHTNVFHDDLEKAALAISEVGVRKKDRNAESYVATGLELRNIYFGIQLFEFFLNMATKGHLMTAKIRAADMVVSKLMKVWHQLK